MRTLRTLFLVLGVIIALFSVGEAQKRVSVSSVTFDSAVDDVQWAGKKHEFVLVKTVGGRLYRSEDGGKAWAPLMDVLRHAIKSKKGENSGELIIDTVRVNPVDKRIIMVASTRFHHFISEDSGKTWRHIHQNQPIHSWVWHPTKAHYALLSMWTEGCEDDITPPEEKPCSHNLFYTEDLGRSFRLVQSYVVQFSWGDKSTHSEDKIFFTHHRHKIADQPRYMGWSKTVDFSVMSLPSRASMTLVQQGNKFLVSNGYIFVARLTNAANQAVDLFVSTDGGKTFVDSVLPFELVERSYTILDTSAGAVVLHVNHGEEAKAGTGNIYVSDAAGLRFALSLPNNVRSSSGECEFDKVASMEGTYLANYREFFQGAEEGSQHATDAANQAGNKKSQRKKYPSLTRTAVTFDKGAIWNHLRAPKVDSTGQKISCSGMQGSSVNSQGVEENCWLHLHGVTNFHNYAPFYSVENAVGLVMGTGNVGPYLRQEPEVTNTYLSRDGGLNWMEVHKGAFIYEFGDHGSLIVMADDLRKTSQVVFSWNEGQSWFDFDLGEDPIDVDNIVVEPNASSVQFLLYGTRGETGVMYHLDFATLQQPACKGVWAADSVSSDYETWTPSNGQGTDTCLLGKQVTFTRRKQAAECFNGETFERPVVKKNCQCTMADYECEFGFSRAVGSTECKPDNLRLFANEKCHSDGYRYVVGYRKVPGDSCEGGIEPPVIRVPCPEARPAGMMTILFRVVLGGGALYFILNFLTQRALKKNPLEVVAGIRDGSVDTTSSLDAIRQSIPAIPTVFGKSTGKIVSAQYAKLDGSSRNGVASAFDDEDDDFGASIGAGDLSSGVQVGAEFFDEEEQHAQGQRLALELGGGLASSVDHSAVAQQRRPTATMHRLDDDEEPELPTLAPPPKFTGSTLLDENFD